MRIGYLMNSYPMTSTTFIRSEIRAIEATSIEVQRYAIRCWDEPLVEVEDKAEQARTHYLLTGRLPALIAEFFAELVTNPRGMVNGLATWFMLIRNAGGGIVPHTAYLFEAVSLKRRTLRDQIRHVHTHFSTNSAAVALLCKELGGPSYSFTAHGPDEFVEWSRASLPEKVAAARFVVAISHFCRVQLARAAGMGAWKKLHVVRCGIDLTQFTESGAPFDGNATFVCVGRLCRQKAQVLLIEAVRQVAYHYPGVRIVLIGDGDSRLEIEQAIARHGLQDNVELMGWRSNAEVREMVSRSRALVLPSFAEGLPVVIMEALALGRPVISTYIAGIPELVDRRCGWIIPAGSEDDLARAMIEALETSAAELTEMGRQGRRRVLIAHDVRQNAQALRDLLGEHLFEAGEP